MKKKTFIVLEAIITALSFVGTFLFKVNPFKILDDFADISFNICVSVFSSMILVFFIDGISNHIQEKQTIQVELEYIKRFNNILKLYIDQYVLMYYCVSTPLKNRKFENVNMPENFKIKDMRDLHGKTLLVKEGFFGSSIDGFLKVELILRNELISLVERYNFSHYPQFVKIFTDYIKASLYYDCRSAIEDSAQMLKGNKKYKETLLSLFENEADEFYSKMEKDEEVNANIVHPYIFLYKMMQMQRKTILDYKNEITKIFGKNSSKK